MERNKDKYSEVDSGSLGIVCQGSFEGGCMGVMVSGSLGGRILWRIESAVCHPVPEFSGFMDAPTGRREGTLDCCVVACELLTFWCATGVPDVPVFAV